MITARAAELEAALEQLESETEAACAEVRRKPIDLKGLPKKNTEIAVARPRPPKPEPSDPLCNEVWGSRQATCATRDAKQLQCCLAWPLELDGEGNYLAGHTEEWEERAVAEYTYSVKQLAAAFPKLELSMSTRSSKACRATTTTASRASVAWGELGCSLGKYGQKNLASASASSRRIATNH